MAGSQPRKSASTNKQSTGGERGDSELAQAAPTENVVPELEAGEPGEPVDEPPSDQPDESPHVDLPELDPEDLEFEDEDF